MITRSICHSWSLAQLCRAFISIGSILLLVGCYTLTLKDLRNDSNHTVKVVSGSYQILGVCLSRWLDENTAGARIPKHYAAEKLFQVQGPRNSAAGGFQTLVELREIGEGETQVDIYVANDLIRFSSESITERFLRGLSKCVGST